MKGPAAVSQQTTNESDTALFVSSSDGGWVASTVRRTLGAGVLWHLEKVLKNIANHGRISARLGAP